MAATKPIRSLAEAERLAKQAASDYDRAQRETQWAREQASARIAEVQMLSHRLESTTDPAEAHALQRRIDEATRERTVLERMAATREQAVIRAEAAQRDAQVFMTRLTARLDDLPG